MNAGGVRLRGRRLYSSAVHRILRRRLYSGDFDWDGNTYQGAHEALVSRECWQHVQELLDARAANHTRKVKHDFAYTGLVHCGHSLRTATIRSRPASRPCTWTNSTAVSAKTSSIGKPHQCAWSKLASSAKYGALQTVLFEPFEILRHSNQESYRNEKEKTGSGREIGIWLPSTDSNHDSRVHHLLILAWTTIETRILERGRARGRQNVSVGPPGHGLESRFTSSSFKQLHPPGASAGRHVPAPRCSASRYSVPPAQPPL
jgi:hypothetical protein